MDNREPEKLKMIGARAGEKVGESFEKVEGKTNLEKLNNLLAIYEKFQVSNSKLAIESNIETIDNAFNTINTHLKAIVSSTRQYEQTIKDKYTDTLEGEIRAIKSNLEDEEKLKLEIDTLINSLEETKLQLTDKTEQLEENIKINIKLDKEISELKTKNISLIENESKYINQLRELENDLKNKDKEIIEVQKKSQNEIDDMKGYISNLKQSNVVLESNLKGSNTENTELKNSISLLKKEHKEEIKELKKECKEELEKISRELKELKNQYDILNIEKAKTDSKLESLKENNLELKKELKQLKK